MKLLEPLAVGRTGGLAAPSRVLFGPHETNLCAPGTRAIGERHVAYYERRAAGGAGIIVTEEASVHPSDWPYERAPLASECAGGWARVADAVHRHGAVALAAIGHSGGQGSSAYSQAALWAPSPVPDVATREVPMEMEAGDIAAVIDGYASAAALARAAGMDGVEVNAGQFSLLRQFLSGLTNQRADGYGADRMRLLREVLVAVRAALGDAVLALRLSLDEMAPWAGIVPEAGAAIAVDVALLVDVVSCVRGSIFTGWATRPDGHEAPGFGIELARQCRAALGDSGHDHVRVFAQGSIVDAGQAEWALDSGAADGVEMTRAQLADAELVAKLRRGEPARVRPCILCNQLCKVRDNRNPIVSCVVDPRTGHELHDPDPDPDPAAGPGPDSNPDSNAASRGSVTVVGGGVAGLECARVAARRGWAVRVLEASDGTGGAVRLAARGAGRERLGAIVDWLDAECRALGVTIETGRRVGHEELTGLAASGALVVAAGGRDRPVAYPLAPGAAVLSAAEYLGGDPHVGGPVVVWDPLGGPIGVSVAERLAAAGAAVTLATPDLLVGEKLSLSGDLAPAQVRLHSARVVLVKRVLLREVHAGFVVVEDRFSGVRQELAATVVVDCGHRLPSGIGADDPASGTAGIGAVEGDLPPSALVVGDALAPRTVHEAVLEGRRAALGLR